MKQINVNVENYGNYEYPFGISLYEVCEDLKINYEVVGAKINNELNPLTTRLVKDTDIKFIDSTDLAGYKIYKAGLQFIFEVALKETFPEFEVIYEHSVPKGLLAEIIGNRTLTQKEMGIIKGNMAKIIAEDLKFEKYNISKRDAIEYFEKGNQIEKAQNIENSGEEIITLYKLKDFLNYYYTEMPYTTKSISKFDLVYLGNNRLVFLWPSARSEGKVPEYVHYGNIINSFLNGKNWLEKMEVPYLADLNKLVSTSKIKELIEANELLFNQSIAACAEKIAKNNEKKVVLIAGPSSAGKTTTTKRLSAYLKVRGLKPISISVDDYFVDREKTPKDENGEYDFECLMAIDVERFNKDLMDLLNGKAVDLPTYDFVSGTHTNSGKEVSLADDGIILVEGLHALNDELTPHISSLLKYKIYLSPFIPLNIDKHNYISTLDLRLLRRLIRDNRTRGLDVSGTIKIWQSVRNGEEKYIFPYIHQADIIINTALSYELGVVRVYAEPLLYSVGIDSPYYEEARRLINFLKRFYLIPTEYIPKDSILREFIGYGE
ncbi:MAG: nucleoside kinase [Bacilli bacterium]|nr:nucleoside kinase [Bacilli bacterium]